MLESLDENHKAISITIGSFALGFSGKLETGDIVGILVYDQVAQRRNMCTEMVGFRYS